MNKLRNWWAFMDPSYKAMIGFVAALLFGCVVLVLALA